MPSPASAMQTLHGQLDDVRSPLMRGQLGRLLSQARLIFPISPGSIARSLSPRARELVARSLSPKARSISPTRGPEAMWGADAAMVEHIFSQLAHKLNVFPMAEVVDVLDKTAQRLARRRPDVWCLPFPVEAADLVARDPEGASAVVAAWESLRLPTIARVGVL